MRNGATTFIAHKAGLSQRMSGPALVVLLVAGLLLAALVSLYNPALAFVGVLALTMLLLGLREPQWAAVVLVSSLAVVPVELSQNTLFGHNIENPLQILVPLTLVVALLSALKDREMPTLIVPDLLIVGLVMWGLLSLANAGQMPFDSYWKKYGNKLIFPLGFYVIVRLLSLDHRGIMQIIRISVILVVIQAFLIIVQAKTGMTVLYGDLHGGYPTGPFAYFWTAAAFLAMWPPLIILATSRARSRTGWALGFLALLITAYAITRTGQRGATFLLLLEAPLCLLAPSMRKTALAAIAVGAMLYIPWSMTGSGGDLLSRFDETDESRVAYRTVALEMVRSDRWDPIFGVGPYISPREMRGMQIETGAQQFLMHGRKVLDVSEIAESGHALHNVYLSLLVEFGSVGAFLAGLAWIWLTVSAIRLYLNPAADRALLIGVMGALIGWGGIGYIHNIYSFAAPMALFFFFYGLVVGKQQAFFERDVERAQGRRTEPPVLLRHTGSGSPPKLTRRVVIPRMSAFSSANGSPAGDT
ncbi:MAG TPA: hypothetical protein DEP45_13475 [Armatimonadetes bacterium]|nr:hypothetical protein [Armatimonadota bacterium]